MNPVFHNIKLDNPERAAAHPALVELFTKGWTVATSFVGEREGEPELVLLLAPPRPLERPLRHYLSIMTATAVGVAVGALCALLAASALGA